MWEPLPDSEQAVRTYAYVRSGATLANTSVSPLGNCTAITSPVDINVPVASHLTVSPAAKPPIPKANPNSLRLIGKTFGVPVVASFVAPNFVITSGAVPYEC